MLGKRKNICVYCASSGNLDKEYTDAATLLGNLMAEDDRTCICGAGRTGLMGAVSNGCLEAGGKVVGIIPQFMVERGWCHPALSEVIITENIHDRKQKMAQMADALVALPGGCGTFEELLEVITWKQLGLLTKPIIILNTKQYYNPLIEMLNKAVEENFMRKSHSQLWSVATTPEEVMLLVDKIPETVAEQKY